MIVTYDKPTLSHVGLNIKTIKISGMKYAWLTVVMVFLPTEKG